jgi:hypothetical protein
MARFKFVRRAEKHRWIELGWIEVPNGVFDDPADSWECLLKWQGTPAGPVGKIAGRF